TLALPILDEFAQTILAQRISMVSGVAAVRVYATMKYAVRVDVDPRKLAGYSIGIDEVANSISNANVNLPTGTIYGADKTLVLQADGQMFRAGAFGRSIIAYRNGNPVRLDEVAHVFDGVEIDKQMSWYQGDRCIYLSIQKQPGTNVVAVVDEVKKVLPELIAQMPAAAKLDVRSDQSVAIRHAVDDVQLTLLLTIALVVLVI